MGISVTWARRFLVGGGLLLFALWWTYSKKPELAPSLHVVENPTAADVDTQPAEPVDDGKTDVQRWVDKTLSGNRVVIFSKSYCGFSRKAKRAIGNHLPADKYVVIELDQREDGWEIQQYMRTLTGASTVPRWFVDGVFRGGGDDAEAMDASGELKQLLVSKGIL